MTETGEDAGAAVETASARPAGSSGRAGLARHGGGFLLAGLTAFAVDAGVLLVLTRAAGQDPFTARLLAIAAAMVVAWLINRRITFAVTAPPSVGEFMRYAAVAWTAALVNYAIYAGILLVSPATAPLTAMALATAISMTVSYVGMRFGVFARR